VVIALFMSGPEQHTIPRRMWSGIRELISPTITSVATLLIIVSIVMMITMELLRRRGERLRGVTPN
jgi:putative spermidine/putrescine transport system permease protein